MTDGLPDYAVQVRVKNNWFLTKMHAAGFKTVAELSRASKVTQAQIGLLINLKLAPIGRSDDWREIVQRLSVTMRCLPEDLFPPQHHRKALTKNTAELKLDAAAVQHILPSANEADRPLRRMEASRAIDAALAKLTARQERAIRLRYGIGTEAVGTYDQLGEELGGVSRERARQIEVKALRTLQHPSRLKDLKGIIEDICDE